MDSLTQLVLSATVGETVLGRKVGRKAALWGCVVGTLPDLDILLQFDDPIKTFTYHRSFSHSIFVYVLAAPVLAWFITRLHKQPPQLYKGWLSLVFLCLVTHALLDAFTVYGTQLLWPLLSSPVSWGSLFIIDPLYTVPLLMGTLTVLLRRQYAGGYMCRLGLVLSTAYLLLSVCTKLYVENAIERQLLSQSIVGNQYRIVPTAFNIALWRVLVMSDDGYYEGLYSIFDKRDVQLKFNESRNELLPELQNYWPVNRLQWFTQGFYAIEVRKGKISVIDLRMGASQRYVFSFQVAELKNGVIYPINPVLNSAPTFSVQDIKWVFRRIWNEQIDTLSTHNTLKQKVN